MSLSKKSQTPLLLFHLVQFFKCWRIFLEYYIFLGMIQTFLPRGASLWIMQTTQKFTLQIPFPRLEHFNRDVANTLHLFTSCEGIQDRLGFWIPRCGFQIPGTVFQSLSVELGFWISLVSGIPDSMSCIPDSKTRDSGFHKQIFPVSGFPYMGWTCLSKIGWRRILRTTRLLCGEILIPM